MMKYNWYYKFFTIILFWGTACTPSYYKYIPKNQKQKEGPSKPDYRNISAWAAHPEKWDPSDSVPEPFKETNKKERLPVFFVHPTTLTEQERIYMVNGDIGNDSINTKTDYSSILYQASIFNGVGNVYAPRYRQAHIYMYYEKDTIKARAAFDTAYGDVRIAFENFIYNIGNQPFIIASHSQGTQHAVKLIKEVIDGQELQKQLVIAYLVGMPVKKMEFKNINTCKDSTETGCFVSWRTFRRDFEGPTYLSKENEISVTNPLTWTQDNENAPRTLHEGAILYKFNKLFKNPSDAQIHDKILWISRPKFFGSFLFTMKNYHAGDYNLFYSNIRTDVARRVKYFKEKEKKLVQ